MNKFLIFIIAPFLIISGCEKSTESEPGMGTLKIYLVDSPGEYEQVNIVVKSVAVHMSNTDTVTGWTIINNTPTTYDLLRLRSCKTAGYKLGDN